MVPAPGWSGEYEWIGEVPFEEMPHVLIRADTCPLQQPGFGDDYPIISAACGPNGYRARRIKPQMIEPSVPVSLDDCREIADGRHLSARHRVRAAGAGDFPATGGLAETGDLNWR